MNVRKKMIAVFVFFSMMVLLLPVSVVRAEEDDGTSTNTEAGIGNVTETTHNWNTNIEYEWGYYNDEKVWTVIGENNSVWPENAKKQCRAIRKCDDEGCIEIDVLQTVDATVSSEKEETYEATCTKGGRTTYIAPFDETYGGIQKILLNIKALGHTWGEWRVTSNPTFETAGELTRTCTVDGKTETFDLPALNNKDYTYDVISEATCETTGTGKYTYSKDNQTFEFDIVIEASHKLIRTLAFAASCEKAGHITGYTCSVCGKHFSDAEGKNEIAESKWIIPAGHKLQLTVEKAATCTEAGNTAYYTCSECGKYYSDAAGTQEIAKDSWKIPAKHQIRENVIDSTASKEGSIVYSCAVCGYVQEKLVLPQTERFITLGQSASIISDATGCTFTFDAKKYTNYLTLDTKTGKITTKKNPKFYKNIEGSIPVKVKVGGKTYTVKVKLKIPAPTIKITRKKVGTRYRYVFKYNIPGATKIKVRSNLKGMNTAVVDKYLSKPKSDSESYINLDLGKMKKVKFSIVAYYGKKASEPRIITK